MQKYIKTFRVLSLAILSILILTVIWGAGYVVFEDEQIEGLTLLLFLIPIYIVGQYILLTAKGEEAVEQLSTKAKKTILYSNMIALTTMLVMPVLISGYFVKDYVETEAKSERLAEGISQDVISWPEDSGLGERVTVKTRWNVNGRVDIILKSIYDDTEYKQKYTHSVVFRDKDGFEINDHKFSGFDYTLNGKTKKLTGVTAEDRFWMSANEYIKIRSVDVLFYSK